MVLGGSRHAGVNSCVGLGWKRILLEAGTLECRRDDLDGLVLRLYCWDWARSLRREMEREPLPILLGGSGQVVRS